MSKHKILLRNDGILNVIHQIYVEMKWAIQPPLQENSLWVKPMTNVIISVNVQKKVNTINILLVWLIKKHSLWELIRASLIILGNGISFSFQDNLISLTPPLKMSLVILEMEIFFFLTQDGSFSLILHWMDFVFEKGPTRGERIRSLNWVQQSTEGAFLQG